MSYNYSDILQLREERAGLVAQAGEIRDAAAAEERPMTDEESARFDEIHDNADELRARIEQMEADRDRANRQAEVEAHLNESQGVVAGRPDTHPSENREQPRTDEDSDDALLASSIRSWILGGRENLSEEQRAAYQRSQDHLPHELRVLATGTNTAGGFTVPQGFMRQLHDAEQEFGGMRAARTTVINTADGAELLIPTSNDTGNTGQIVNESSTVPSNVDPVFNNVAFNSFMYTSRIVLVPIQLLQDSAFDLNAWLAVKLGERIGRITNTHFTVGDHASKPNGAVTASSKGADAAAVGSISATDFLNLTHSVDPAYRRSAELMFNDSTLLAAKKLTVGASDARPLWQPGIGVGAPDTIDGYRYVINQDMPAIGANDRSVLFGDFSTYYIRDVAGATLFRFTERYMENLQVGVMAYSRHDGDLVDAGAGPLKHLLHPAS